MAALLTTNAWAVAHPNQAVTIDRRSDIFDQRFGYVAPEQRPHISGWVTVLIPHGTPGLSGGGIRFYPRSALSVLGRSRRKVAAGHLRTKPRAEREMPNPGGGGVNDIRDRARFDAWLEARRRYRRAHPTEAQVATVYAEMNARAGRELGIRRTRRTGRR